MKVKRKGEELKAQVLRTIVPGRGAKKISLGLGLGLGLDKL